MNKGVDKKSFWRQRLNLAKKNGYLHYSVYLANPDLWKLICDTHEEIMKKEIKPEDRVLDIGCAFGRISPLFENYLGVDFSPDFIEEAKRLYPNKKFEIQDINNLPYEDKSFDVGIAISMKHMILGNLGREAWDVIEKELKRVCKKVLILEYGEKEDYTDNRETIGQYEII